MSNASNLHGLKLAILAPISWPTPPAGYGPWEQIAADIAEGMYKRGLDVTLFATGNSQFSGHVSSVIPVGLNEDRALSDEVYTSLHISSLFEQASKFDLIHNSFDWKPLTYACATKTPPVVTTIHGFSSPSILAAYYACAHRSFFCSISDSDRDPGLQYAATVHNGVNVDEFTFADQPGKYLVFLGRFHEEKGAHLAIEIAKRTGMPLKIAAIPQDEQYFRTAIEPHIDGNHIQFLGSVNKAERNELLKNALALVHMTTRPERFGLTMIEAMACGTPVLGARMGSIPEIVADGVTGYLCDSIDDAVEKAPLLAGLQRTECRKHVLEKFSVDRMVDGYVNVYRQALELQTPPKPTEENISARQHDWWDRPMGFTDIPTRPISLKFATS